MDNRKVELLKEALNEYNDDHKRLFPKKYNLLALVLFGLAAIISHHYFEQWKALKITTQAQQEHILKLESQLGEQNKSTLTRTTYSTYENLSNPDGCQGNTDGLVQSVGDTNFCQPI